MREIEYLTSEYKKLVSWGLSTDRLAVLPTLRQLAGADDAPDWVIAVELTRRNILETIKAMDGWYEFKDRRYPAETMIFCYRVLFKVERSGWDAQPRREEVIRKLGLTIPANRWRRLDGPERPFLRILAEHSWNYTYPDRATA